MTQELHGRWRGRQLMEVEIDDRLCMFEFVCWSMIVRRQQDALADSTRAGRRSSA
jgi:hypothetical protein